MGEKKFTIEEIKAMYPDVDFDNRLSDLKPHETLFPNYIICLEDGNRLQSLKRHLKVKYNLTPEQYRIKHNLPVNYPMVCQEYAARRSAIAKQIGLGSVPRGKQKKKVIPKDYFMDYDGIIKHQSTLAPLGE